MPNSPEIHTMYISKIAIKQITLRLVFSLFIHLGDVFALTANPDDPTSLGIYTCEAVNCMGRVYSSSKVNIGKEYDETLLASADDLLFHAPPPVFTTELKDLKIKLGDTFTLGCQGNGF